MAGACASQRIHASDCEKSSGGLGKRATGKRSMESHVLPVEGSDRSLGDVRQCQNPFGWTNFSDRHRQRRKSIFVIFLNKAVTGTMVQRVNIPRDDKKFLYSYNIFGCILNSFYLKDKKYVVSYIVLYVLYAEM